ncbi:MAG: RNA polymerase sigma factor [Acidobacteria bacterium]|nr:RNA polymerase sigma factor [Acidobacteriota bacterium]
MKRSTDVESQESRSISTEACLESATVDRESRFLRLIAEHQGAVRRLAVSYERDPAKQEDLVQDIYLALWRALPGFRGECSELTFLFRVAHNRAVNHVIRSRRTLAENLEDAEVLPYAGADPEHLAAQRQNRERLLRAVRQLPLGLREVITLVLESLTHREIAEVIGISENNVAVRANRARRELRRKLLPQEGD